MCWNAPVSLVTFLTSILMCGYIWQRNMPNDRPLSIWIAWFSLVQLFEFFMWRNMTNHTVISKLAFVSILAQPFVLAGSLYYYYSDKDSWRKQLLLFIAGLSLIKTIVAGSYAFSETRAKWLSEKGPNCHLIWWFVKEEKLLPILARVDTVYGLSLLAATLLIKPFNQGVLYSLFGTLTYGITKLFYPRESGSLWCWVANLLAILTLARPSIKI